MKRESDLEQELLDACGFWKKFSGEDRRVAHSVFVRWYWALRLIAGAFFLGVRFSFRAARHKKPPRCSCDALLIYLTSNQRKAFDAWTGAGPEIQTASWMDDADWDISWARCGWLSLYYFWPVYRLLRRRSDYALTLPWLQEFVRYRVGLVLAHDLYRRANPKIVVVSNDHSGMFVAFIRAGRDFGCRIVYTQHACIGRNFPALNFDLSLLDGTQAYLHYRESGVPKGTILITGRARPNVIAATARPEILTVGLATNLDDSIVGWMPLLARLGRDFSSVVLRCHPAETRKLAWRLVCRIFGIRMDEGGLDAFLGSTSVLVSGMSGIILDAALRGVPCLIKLSPLRTSDAMVDYFGYQKFGLCTQVTRTDDLSRLVMESAKERVNLEQVAVYEAGMVQDPGKEKREALLLYIHCVKNDLNVETELLRRYQRVMHDDVPLLMSAAYRSLNDKHGWLAETKSRE